MGSACATRAVTGPRARAAWWSTIARPGFVAKRHKKATRYGWLVVAHRSPDLLGLINLNGSVVAPRPHRPWREKPNAHR